MADDESGSLGDLEQARDPGMSSRRQGGRHAPPSPGRRGKGADAEDASAEVSLPSVLDVLHARFEAEGGRETVTRLLYVGMIPPGASQKTVCMYHKDFLKEIDADVSGLMILHGDCFLNLVEGATDVILALLRHVAKDVTESRTPMMSSVRIVAASEDCPSRAFMTWSFRSVKLKSATTIEFSDDNAVDHAYSVYSKLVQLGRQFTEADLPHADIYAALDKLQQRYADYIPTAQVVQACCAAPQLTSIEEYLDIFDAPVEVDLDCDRVWPAESSLKY